MRKKVMGLGMILAMSAALYGCSEGAAGNKPTEHTTIEETTEKESEEDEKQESSSKEDEKDSKKESNKEEKDSVDEKKDKSDDDRSKSDTDEKTVKTVKTVKKVGKRDEAESDSKVTDEGDKETKKTSSTKKDESVESSVSGSSEVVKEEEKPAENIADNPDVQHQIKVITTASSMWYHPDDASFKYIVTDFDHDGHYEIIAANVQGSGHYTHLEIFEVAETNDGLLQISTPSMEDATGGSIPDIIQNGGYITFSNDSEYVYIASDHVHVSANEGLEAVEGFKLNGTAFESEYLAVKHTVGDTVEYFKPDRNGEVIDETQFKNCSYDRYGADHDSYETQFMWTDLQSGDMTTELMNSYVAFHG
ncbi:MAG: hypothetical protein IKS48_10550 [Eubacterium sp.]|nr:hypothetical protein [Eubacterium sp.]